MTLEPEQPEGNAESESAGLGPSSRPRRPWLAFVLSWFVPGLGQAYAGVPLRGAGAALLYLLVIIPVKVLARVPLDFSAWAVILGILIAIGAGLLIPIDAARTARRRRTLPTTRWNRLWVYVLHVVVVGILLVPAAVWSTDLLGFRTFKIPSGGMMETLQVGDYVIADMRRKSHASVRRGQIVVFRYPPDPEVFFVKRVIGLPGETIELRDGVLYVDENRLEEPYVVPEYRSQDYNKDFGPVLVEQDRYFVLGDARHRSADSRAWGQVPERLLEGTIRSIWWSYEEQPKYPFEDGSQRLQRFVTAPLRLLTHSRWDRIGHRLERSGPETGGG